MRGVEPDHRAGVRAVASVPPVISSSGMYLEYLAGISLHCGTNAQHLVSVPFQLPNINRAASCSSPDLVKVQHRVDVL